MLRINSTHLIFGICSVLFILVNTLTIKDGHNWGDDFAQYIRHAENIVEGKPYSGGVMLEQWVVVPPGFPLLLAPFVKFLGLNFPAMKWLNVFFWQLYAIFAFLLAKNKVGEKAALGIALVVLTAPWFFIFKQNVLSDIPFLFFITLALWGAENYFQGGVRKYFILALLAAGYAVLIRWAGISFFVVWILYALFSRKEQKTIPIVLGVILLLMGIQHWLGISAADHLKELSISAA